jgi:hypothetical protein
VSPIKLATFFLCSSALEYSDGKWKLLNLLLLPRHVNGGKIMGVTPHVMHTGFIRV